MKPALIDRFGTNDVVRIRDMALPSIGVDDLLVRVQAASVNPVDIKTRAGKMQTLFKYRLPLVLGNDVAGVVAQVRDALAYTESGRATGKVVIQVGQSAPAA